MNRTTVALLAALEAAIVVAIGLAICLVPLTVLWATQYHLAADWFTFWRSGVDVWLVGHGVNLTVVLDAKLGAALGLPNALAPFQVTIAALGFAALTAGLGVRTGLRAAETPFRATGAVSAVATFAALATIVTLTAGTAAVQPSVWQGILLPPFVYGLGVLSGLGFASLRRPAASDRAEASTPTRLPQPVRRWTEAVPSAVRAASGAALRAGTAAAALVIAGAALVLALLVFGNFGSIIGLYEQLQSGALGGAALTIGQLALLPNLVIWLASWLIGPGFAIGTGSSVGPFGTDLGPIPGLPLFGVIPSGGFSFGIVGIIVPLIAGFLAAVVLRSRIAEARALHGTRWLFLTALGVGIVAGIELGLLAWWSSGSMGPGRLHDVGPNPWLVGSIAAAEVAVVAVIGLVAGGRTRR
ncbi:DUF6350 family protein [Leifsonia sp. NPDC058292]|uniref:cell division protein PerM n=1 Tax=Leifsonia sp. NPDC058292 TaxID=3346428 RepID=UPI0036D9E931